MKKRTSVDGARRCAVCLWFVCVCCAGAGGSTSQSCNMSRNMYTASWGVITDGPTGSNYTQDSHCEWLIQANNSRQFITLSFRSMGTECSYDYLFVYDGDSFDAPLLGSFSGKTEPQQVVASAGAMLILLYSDTNYVLDGFRAEFSVTDCRNNCSAHGTCVDHACACEAGWVGADCGRRACPEGCGAGAGRGKCHGETGCQCSRGYSGQACSLHESDPGGNRWHWLSESGSGLSPRAAHSAVYQAATDSLYVFGGYDLNRVLDTLAIYRFAASRWEDERGMALERVAVRSELLTASKGEPPAPPQPPVPAKSSSSFYRQFLFTVADNSTYSMRQHEGTDRPDVRGHLARLARNVGRIMDVHAKPTAIVMQEEEEEVTLQPVVEEWNEKGKPIGEMEERTPGEGGENKLEDGDEKKREDGGEGEKQERRDEERKLQEEEEERENRNQEEGDEGRVGKQEEEWEEFVTVNAVRPAGRYGHAACSCPGGFVLYGGQLGNGSLSSELWFFNVSSRRWSLMATDSRQQPPPLTRHSLTLAGRGQDSVYLFGGSTSSGEFSSRLFSIRLVGGRRGGEQWEELHPRGGKLLDLRVVAHSAVYHNRTDSLLIYGGIVTGVARFSKLTDRIFAYHIESRHWSELLYPRAQLRDTYVPRERAFHTSTVIGNYMVVFGGYSHRHNKEEVCYDNHMYLYHLDCHTWVSHDVLGASGGGDTNQRYPKQQGVFAHAADVRGGNTLLVVGGYHGNVNGDLLAYTLPQTLASRQGAPYEPQLVCWKHPSLMECTANPECGWCSADEVCYGRTLGINCTTNLQTTRCPGVCPALGDCHSCLVHGSLPAAAQHRAGGPKRHMGQCTWCVQNARCHHKDDNYGVCGLREDSPSLVPGYWGPKGTEILQVNQCRVLDRRPGLTFLKYHHPANWSQPDYVSVINATTVDYKVPLVMTRTERKLAGRLTARLVGFLRPPESWGNAPEMLLTCASYSTALLVMRSPGGDQVVVSNVSAGLSMCDTAKWPGGDAAVLTPGRHLVDLTSWIEVDAKAAGNPHQQSKMQLQHTPDTAHNAKVFTFEYLEPYSNGSCGAQSNCLACVSDSLCGWCEVTGRCLARADDERETCVPALGAAEDWRYLTLAPPACTNCSNHITCEACAGDGTEGGGGLCEWWVEEAVCARRYREKDAVRDVAQCPQPCHLRQDCSQCLDNRGRCVWCEAMQECFSFSVYTSQYQFGMCRQWVDQRKETEEEMRGIVPRAPNDKCRSCFRHDNCSACLTTLSCGWCYSINNPIQGVCVPGDFGQPHNSASCTDLMAERYNTSGDGSGESWAYAQCPDVDECDLQIARCHKNATCTNTRGSYTCQCKRGFLGDGVGTCAKTCYHTCINGYCTGAPDYTCKCNLGWTGVDCAVNCGCHNHSTCRGGEGKCDECQDWTTGEACERCRSGSYGNATVEGQGCHGCNCNNHGNMAEGICDMNTGACFCQDNTWGVNCDKCKPGYYGDPRHGGLCYYQCTARGMLTGRDPQGLGSRLGPLPAWESRAGSPPSRECLWIISPAGLHNRSSYDVDLIRLTVHADFNVSCDDNSVYVYDGLPDFVSVAHHRTVLGTLCRDDTTFPVTLESRSGAMTVYYKQGAEGEGFNATYTVSACEGEGGQCACGSGLAGPDCGLKLCPGNCSRHLQQGSCDKGYGRCVCAPDYGGEDCSAPLGPAQMSFAELFDSRKLSDGLDHLRKTVPRFGHSLVADRRGSLWMFGGYSPSNGPLNDIRLFDTKNDTWVQVTVDTTRDAHMPRRRYFHAAEIVPSRREIYVHGGLAHRDGVVGDLWRFDLKNHYWSDVRRDVEPPPLTGHTLTLRRGRDSESLLLIGGFSPRRGFLQAVWEFDLQASTWTTLATTGVGPLGVFGHSCVYHVPTQSLYLYGGYMYSSNGTYLSNRLYALHHESGVWSVLPPLEEYNPSVLQLPRARFLHAAVANENYMLVVGGRTLPPNATDALLAYSFTCNLWINLLDHDIKMVGSPPPPTMGHAMTRDPETGLVYVMGGFDGGTASQVTRIRMPPELCNLWARKETCLRQAGCGFCALYGDDGTNTTRCHANDAVGGGGCDDPLPLFTLKSNQGVLCDGDWLSRRSCEQHSTCGECLARWPAHWSRAPACKWCAQCGPARTRCVAEGAACKCAHQRGLTVEDAAQCPERRCAATDCEQCTAVRGCVWTRQVLLTAEMGVQVAADPVYEWTCVPEDITERLSFKVKSVPPAACPPRCSEHRDCHTCLSAPGGEGGWHECRWSLQLRECLAPSYQPLYCAGGVCGLVLRNSDLAQCPQPCSTLTQCSTCLQHAHCGWCALDIANSTGQGICTEGTLDSPGLCGALPGMDKASQGSWHYLSCPAENECLNGHHTCDNQSEQCLDVAHGFQCVCGAGYALDKKSACMPVCAQGCVRGTCAQPDRCECEFGYVGADCSVQCKCNGHSRCAGPDRLDTCLECHNNTKGSQCDKCKPLFVGDPANNGQCVPCIEYCNGHTHICINDSFTGFPFSVGSAADIPLSELEEYLGVGAVKEARCIGCQNHTTGYKCKECIAGNFRGSLDDRKPCRPCECHGHGDMCDPVTGEKCNCGNNTESDPTCLSANSKNSNQQCWMVQCSKCREAYMGTPTAGHQCYRQMTVDSKFCFDAKQLDECKMKPKPLYPGQSVFFVVQPRFMNVDIRVMVDVTQGALDLFLSPRDDTFIVNVNSTTGAHTVDMDSKFRWRGEEFGGLPPARLNLVELTSPGGVGAGGEINVNSSAEHMVWSSQHVYVVMEQEAHGLNTFVTVMQPNTFLVVRNVCDRLVLTLPQDRHNLGMTRFYLALTASTPVGGAAADQPSRPSYGMIFFRQDQLHIDLFVFFSVFFSCFFLFLAACVVAWKAKQAADVRRARRRHVVEMLHMAKRPFAAITLLVDTPEEQPPPSIAASTSHSPYRKKRKGAAAAVGGGPGDVRPVAVEPTDDGVAAVGTVFVRLPGGQDVPVRLALASSLILLARVYPVNGRAFLRRRSSHAPS